MLTRGQKFGIGAVLVGAAGLLTAMLWPKKAAAAEPAGPGPSPTPSGGGTTPSGDGTTPATQPPIGPAFDVHFASPAPLAHAAIIDLIGDGTGRAILPILSGAHDYTEDQVTLGTLAQATVGPKAQAAGDVVAVVVAGNYPSSNMTEDAAVQQFNQHLLHGYDRVIWIADKEMPSASYQAIVQNAPEYVAVLNHTATLADLKSILYGQLASA